jgi:hypothetical protein
LNTLWLLAVVGVVAGGQAVVEVAVEALVVYYKPLALLLPLVLL